jgi:CheY-specific phosphatase CheX
MNIRNNIILFSYNGVVESRRTVLLINSITSQIGISEREIKGILISLKNATYALDYKNISIMLKQINELSQKNSIPIGFIDYDISLYQVLKALTKNMKVKLFKNSSSARLFLDPKAFKHDIRILVFDEEEDNSEKLSKELIRYGYTVVIAKNASDYNELMHNHHYDVVVTHSRLNMNLDATDSSKTLGLSKILIANLPVFMDTAVETLISYTGLEAQKSSHAVKRFDIDTTTNIICAVMRFKGELEGSFVLIFPKDTAIIAMESILGEKVNENDLETIMDGVGELCNTITGSTKTILLNKKIKILFDLPKKYTSLKTTLNDIGNNNGIWIDMQLSGKPFYMFLTK